MCAGSWPSIVRPSCAGASTQPGASWDVVFAGSTWRCSFWSKTRSSRAASLSCRACSGQSSRFAWTLLGALSVSCLSIFQAMSKHSEILTGTAEIAEYSTPTRHRPDYVPIPEARGAATRCPIATRHHGRVGAFVCSVDVSTLSQATRWAASAPSDPVTTSTARVLISVPGFGSPRTGRSCGKARPRSR